MYIIIVIVIIVTVIFGIVFAAFMIATQQLAIDALVVGGLDPVAGHDAGEGDADAGGAVEPGGAGPAGQFLAEVGGEVVAVAGEQVVGGAVELVGAVAHDGVDLGLRREGEAVQDLGPERPTRRFRARPRPVHTRHPAPVVPAICVLLPVDHDAGVQEGGANGPEDRIDAAGLYAEKEKEKRRGQSAGSNFYNAR